MIFTDQEISDLNKAVNQIYIPFFLQMDESLELHLNDALYIRILEQIGYGIAEYKDEIHLVNENVDKCTLAHLEDIELLVSKIVEYSENLAVKNFFKRNKRYLEIEYLKQLSYL